MPESKLKKCRVKKLCNLCTSTQHLSAYCRGNRGEFKLWKICKKGAYYLSWCLDKDNASSLSLSVSSACSDKKLLLSLVKVTVSKNGHKYMLNCLLDSSSQRSYLSDEVVKGLGIKIDSLPAQQFNMKMFFRERYVVSKGRSHLAADFDKTTNGEIKVENSLVQTPFSMWRVFKK